jgi:hypothetical protein
MIVFNTALIQLRCRRLVELHSLHLEDLVVDLGMVEQLDRIALVHQSLVAVGRPSFVLVEVDIHLVVGRPIFAFVV